MVWSLSLHSIFHLSSAPWTILMTFYFTSNTNGCRILVGKHLLILQKWEDWKFKCDFMKALIPLHNAWRSLLILHTKRKRKMGLNKRKLVCGNMNDLEHFSLLEFQKSYWGKKQDISNMQINEFQSHLFPHIVTINICDVKEFH